MLFGKRDPVAQIKDLAHRAQIGAQAHLIRCGKIAERRDANTVQHGDQGGACPGQRCQVRGTIDGCSVPLGRVVRQIKGQILNAALYDKSGVRAAFSGIQPRVGHPRRLVQQAGLSQFAQARALIKRVLHASRDHRRALANALCRLVLTKCAPILRAPSPVPALSCLSAEPYQLVNPGLAFTKVDCCCARRNLRKQSRKENDVHFELVQKVLFKHCDPAGIVFFPRYFEAMNDCVEMFFDEALDWPFEKLLETHGVPTVTISTDFTAPSRHGDSLVFRLVLTRLGATSLTYRLTAKCGDELRFRTSATLVYVGRAGRPVAWPADRRARLAQYLEPDA